MQRFGLLAAKQGKILTFLAENGLRSFFTLISLSNNANILKMVMAYVLIFILFFLTFLNMNQLNQFRRGIRKFKAMEQEIARLKAKLNMEDEVSPSSEERQSQAKTAKELPTPPNPIQPSPIVKKTTRPKPTKKSRKKREWNQERFFSYLGAFLGITGLVFFNLFLGDVLGNFPRFLIMSGFSGLLLGLGFYLNKKEKWVEMGHICRSFSGALFLFATFASSTIDELKWIDSSLLALSVISLGILYNLILGGLCQKKGYMVFHMAINFLVIFLLPLEPLVLMLAFVLTFGLQLFGFFRKEDINSFLSFVFFTIYVIYYYVESSIPTELSSFPYLGLSFSLTALLSFLRLLIRHKEEPQNKGIRFLLYGLPVFWLGIAYVIAESKWSILIPLALGILSSSLVLIGKKKDFRGLLFWPLQILLTGFILILATGGNDWSLREGKQVAFWLNLIFLETSLFIYWLCKYKKPSGISLIAYGSLMLLVPLGIFSWDQGSFGLWWLINRFAFIAGASLFHFKLSQLIMTEGPLKRLNHFFLFLLPLTGVFLSWSQGIFQESFYAPERVGLSIILGNFLWVAFTWVIILVNRKESLKYRLGGIWCSGVILLLLNIIHSVDWIGINLGERFILILPVLLLSLMTLFYSKMKKIELTVDFSVFLLTLVVSVSSFILFYPLSTLIPGLLLLFATFGALLWWQKSGQWEVQASGLLLLMGFFFRHCTHHLQMNFYGGIFNMRLLIELAAILIFYLYLKSSQWTEKHKIPLLNRTIQGTVFTLTWLFVLITLFSHSNRNILSLVLQGSVIVLLIMEKRKMLSGYPLGAVAYVHYILAQVNLSLNTHPYYPFLPGILRSPWFFGLVNLAATLAVIILFYKHVQKGPYPVFDLFKRMKKLNQKIMERRNLTLLIPLFTSLALYFSWTLEATALTIAYFCVCFLLYSAALLLRENFFRHTTSLALLATTIRLIFWDLAQSTMLAKSIAFIGASVIFLIINILYSQFKGRFDNA